MTEARRAAYRKLHESGCFVIANPWDRGTARYLQHLGFPALATTSAGYAFSRGLPDADWAVPRDEMLAHIADIVTAVDLPVSADYESGYAHRPEDVAESVRLCLETGVAGLSIEDATGDAAAPLYELPLAVERIRAASEAMRGSGALLTARAECYLVKHPAPLAESIRRLRAYAEAGADILFAPGAATREDIAEIVAAAAPKPVNVLVGWSGGLTVAEIAALGVRRISVGSGFARAAWGALMRAAEGIARDGSFAGLEGAARYDQLNGFFRRS